MPFLPFTFKDGYVHGYCPTRGIKCQCISYGIIGQFVGVSKTHEIENRVVALTNKHPLVEVFGFPTTNMTSEANRHRTQRLCPYFNNVPNCTKDKANSPLGVCSVFGTSNIAITCPIRFRQDWIIASDAADFFFEPSTTWTSLTEVRLHDKHGKVAGNIDVVLVSYDAHGQVTGFGALEIQGVYISGNVRNPFHHYMSAPQENVNMDWRSELNYPRPDYLSSSRKRLIPQLLYKGGIMNAWNKKSAVALDQGFFNTLPSLTEVKRADADVAWLVYDLKYMASADRYQLAKQRVVYTKFSECVDIISKPDPGDEQDFLKLLQLKLTEKLENEVPPENQMIEVKL